MFSIDIVFKHGYLATHNKNGSFLGNLWAERQALDFCCAYVGMYPRLHLSTHPTRIPSGCCHMTGSKYECDIWKHEMAIMLYRVHIKCPHAHALHVEWSLYWKMLHWHGAGVCVCVGEAIPFQPTGTFM